jgi:hypothetical protein
VPSTVEIDGAWYVVLRAPSGIAAIYRVQSYGALMLVVGAEARRVRERIEATP